MKQYRITVNGKSYDVTVEELSGMRQSPSGAFGAGSASYSAPPANIQPTANVVSSANTAAPTASEQGSSNAAKAAPANNGSILTIKAPMPGTVISFKVIVGQKVKRGDVLLLLEAMKMEHSLIAPFSGRVVEMYATPNTQAAKGSLLLRIEEAA